MTVFVFQEPSLLSSLQDNGLTDVMLHALLIKDVSPICCSVKNIPCITPCKTHTHIYLKSSLMAWKSYLTSSVCSIETNWDLIIKIPAIYLYNIPGRSFLSIYTWFFQVSSNSLYLLSRFLLPVKSLVPSQMYLVHSAWMHEVFSHLYSVSLLNVSSKFFCLQITSPLCGGGGVLIPLVSHQDLSYNK